MDREELKTLLLDQSKRKPKKDSVPRELLPILQKQLKTPFIIIISGIRRCGKSTLLDQVRQENDGYYVNFDDERFVNFRVEHFQMMYELLIELFGEKDYFFFDEIQNIEQWERFVRRLHDEGKKIFLTGSNATMLSKELGTHLTGRHLTYSLYPFSFKEFLIFNKYQVPSIQKMTTKEKSLLKKQFRDYTVLGGFPEFLKTQEKEYLTTVYENILYRDIITRYKLPSERPIKEVVHFTASNVGKEISFNALRKLTNLTSATTIREYFEF
ncbi:MAG: ATP-binding protein [bacterium]|nr:ATP-binding protein [bacterium]